METIHGNLSPRLDAGLLYISPWKLGLNEDPSHRHSCSIEAPACMPLCHGSQGDLVCFVRPAAVVPAVGIRLGWSPEVVARDQPCRMALAGHHRWGNGSSSKALFSSIHSSVYFRLHCWDVHLLTDCTTILGGIVGIISIAT